MATLFTAPTGIKVYTGEGGADLGITKGLIFTPYDFSMAVADFVDQDKINEAIAAGNMFPVMNIFNTENVTGDYGTDASDTGEERVTFRPPRRMRYLFNYPQQLTKALNSYAGQRMRVFEVTETGHIKATTSDEGANVQGLGCSYIFNEDPTEHVADGLAKGVLRVEYSDRTEWTERPIYYKSAFATYLDGVQQVVIPDTATVTTNEFSLTVEASDSVKIDPSTGQARTYPISGLTEENLEIIDQDDNVLDPSTDYTVTESTSTPGTYEIDATVGSLTSGTAQVIATSTPNLNLYKSNVCTLSA